MKKMSVKQFVAKHRSEFPTIAKTLGIKSSTAIGTLDYQYSLDSLRDTFTAPYSNAPTKSASSATPERKTIAEFDFTTKTIRLMKTNPVYRYAETYKDEQQMSKCVWKQIFSPKTYAVTFKANGYTQVLKSMIATCEMYHYPMDILVPVDVSRLDRNRYTKLHTTREFTTWYVEQEERKFERRISADNYQLLKKHAPELRRFVFEDIDNLIDYMQEVIRSSGYDVHMQSIFTSDGLNSGVVEDTKGKHEWSREYTKKYERGTSLKHGEPIINNFYDLLMMYINCKFYAEHDIEKNTDGIGRHDVDSYTGGNLATASVNALTWTARHEYNKVISFESASTLCKIWNSAIDEPFIKDRDEVVVPRSACGLGLQNYMD